MKSCDDVQTIFIVADLLQMTGGGVQTEQLPGIIACQTDDVIRHNWHGLFYVVFSGCFSILYATCRIVVQYRMGFVFYHSYNNLFLHLFAFIHAQTLRLSFTFSRQRISMQESLVIYSIKNKKQNGQNATILIDLEAL